LFLWFLSIVIVPFNGTKFNNDVILLLRSKPMALNSQQSAKKEGRKEIKLLMFQCLELTATSPELALRKFG
jgi:hypothetical protein